MSDEDNKPMPMTLIPVGTTMFEPDALGRVTLQFPTLDDAIIFYELFREVTKK